MILHCNFEELGALKQGGHAFLGEGSGEGSSVAAPPEGRAEVEALLPRLSGDLTIQTLSEQRASNVKNALVGQGVNPNRITTIGFGEVAPIADNSTPEGRAQNRRVEVEVVGLN